MIKIGSLSIDNEIFLGPMAGVTDLPFRLLCREMGCGMACTEMISAKAVHFGNKNTEELLRTSPQDAPLAVQIFGSEPWVMAETAASLCEGPWQIIDINMGCPVPKVVNNHEGSALMKDPGLVFEIVSAVVKASDRPVTVKIRKGWDDNSVNAPEIAHICESAGAAAVAVHGRTRDQYYHGSADWDIIRQVKERVSIPVIGNGDAASYGDVIRMKEETGCDGVMIARAALGDPWLFRRIACKDDNIRTSGEELKSMMLRHLEMQTEYDGSYMGMLKMRKHLAWYTKNRHGGARFRDNVNHIESPDRLREYINSLDF